MFGGKGCACRSMETKEVELPEGWPQSERMPEGAMEMCGKNYKLVYRQSMYRKSDRALVVLGIWREDFEEFDIGKLVDEVGFTEGAKPKKAVAAKKVLKRPSARVANVAEASKKDLKMRACVANAAKRATANFAKPLKTVLKRPSGMQCLAPDGLAPDDLAPDNLNWCSVLQEPWEKS